MNNGYQIHDQSATYYMTFQVVEWVDIFTRPHYKQIITSSFEFCRKQKGLQLYAYVIMTNHLHLIAGTKSGYNLSDTIRDFKKFTAHQLLKDMHGDAESRKDWMLKRFEFAAARHTRNSNFQIWTHENHPIELFSMPVIKQKMNYIHQNPVRAGIVLNPEDYVYCSASNYANKPSVIEIDMIW